MLDSVVIFGAFFVLALLLFWGNLQILLSQSEGEPQCVEFGFLETCKIFVVI